MIHQKYLTTLGLMARTVRFTGLGPLLQLSLDFADAILLKLGKPPLKVFLDGHTIYGCFRHRSFLSHLPKRNYEPFTVELFKNHLRAGMTMVDGGAHVGFYTLLSARLIGDSGRIYSFEPDPLSFQCLLINIHKNSYKNVYAKQKAISNKVNKAIFYQSSGTISSSLGKRDGIENIFKGIFVKKLLVQSTTLDSELEGSPVDIIKFDIEGAEPLALQGMSRILESNRSLTIFAEINPNALYTLNSSPQTLIYMLKQLGFTVYFIEESRRKLLPINGEDFMQKGMLYCRRNM